MLKSDKVGVAFAHLTLPADAYVTEVKAVADAVDGLGEVCTDSHVSYLTGQSDVMLQLRVRDFRAAFSFEYASQSTGANWLFAVPYVGMNGGSIEKQTGALNYVLHLRLNRTAYRNTGAAAEAEIVKRITSLIDGEMSGEVLAGFGWSDLIVTGRFCDAQHLRTFVQKLEKLCDANALPIFRRLLTLVSYDSAVNGSSNAEASTMRVYPIILGRALPTSIPDAAAALTFGDSTEWKTISLDGKWDVLSMLTTADGMALDRFIRLHRQLAIDGERPMSSFGIERLETHLLSHLLTADDMSDAAMVSSPRCGCIAAVADVFDEDLFRACEPRLPEALKPAIKNVLNLFRSAATDQTNCCDITPALRATARGLNRLLRRYLLLCERLDSVSAIDTKDTSAGPSWWFPFVVRARQDIADWCTYAERIVSQRTVGRFEEFLAQNERVVSYRGGIQKLLYLTDALLNSYAARVLEPGESPAFMSLFDPIDTVFAMRIGGFVRVPVRYLFILPLTITHLWHEVGVFRFYTKYEQPFDSRTAARLKANASRLSLTPRDRNIDLMLDVTDSYGDAVTLMNGFGGDLHSFMISLATAQFEQSDFRLAPTSQRNRYLKYLLTRLYVALEFRQIMEEIREKTLSNRLTFTRDDIQRQPPHDTVIRVSLKMIVDVLKGELLEFPRYSDIDIDDEVVERARQNIGECIDAVHRAYLTELAFELADAPPITLPNVDETFNKVLDGQIVALSPGPEIDALFLRMQKEMIASLRTVRDAHDFGSATFFASISALVRSSILAFYQHEPHEPERRSKNVLADLWRGRGPTGAIPDLQVLR